MRITQLFMTNNPCYTNGNKITPKGIVVHSTGANNPYIRRYVQPDDGIIGKNTYNNHWNKASATKCVHAFIGKIASGEVACYQVLPWNCRAWGVGKGSKGSYNSSHIQFEICEDGLTNEAYYNEAFQTAAELCAYLCKEYNISVGNIVGHYEAHLAGYANNHADPRNWQKKFGGTMDAFRAKVAELLGTEAPVIEPPATPATPTESSNTLREGDSGTKVAKLQEMLVKAGYALPKYGVDSHFGKETKTAVEAFQKANGLTVDGICGDKTWAKLEEVLNDFCVIEVTGSMLAANNGKVRISANKAELKALISNL